MLFESYIHFYAIKGTEKYSYGGTLVDSKRYGDDGFELTYEITYNGRLITIIVDSEGNQIVDNSTIYFTDWDICESYRIKKIFDSTLREYYGDTYEELSEILLEELIDGLPSINVEERIESTLREYLEVPNIELEEVTSTIIERLDYRKVDINPDL